METRWGDNFICAHPRMNPFVLGGGWGVFGGESESVPSFPPAAAALVVAVESVVNFSLPCFCVKLLFRFARNRHFYAQGAVLFNLASSASRNYTITRARATSKTQATPPITLVQEAGLVKKKKKMSLFD